LAARIYKVGNDGLNQAVRTYDTSILHVRLMLHYLRLFTRPVLFLIILLAAGCVGYVYIEKYTISEGIYMTVITISTVGFSEVRPLSTDGRTFTIFLILGGVVFYAFAINAIFRVILERSFKGFMSTQLVMEKLKRISGHYIVCGGGRMAVPICYELEKAGHPFVVIEKNMESPVFKIISEKNPSWLIFTGDALSEDALKTARIEHAEGIFSVLPTDADNLFVVLSARGLNSSIWIETRISQESTRPKMLQAGANRVLSPYHVAGVHMARSMLKPQMDDFVEVYIGNKNFEFEVKLMPVSESDPLIGQSIAAANSGQTGFTIVAIQNSHGKLTYAPPAETILEAGMQLFYLGKTQD
jgi:voltage-gated potassium channel